MADFPCEWPLALCSDALEAEGVSDVTQCPSIASLSPAMQEIVVDAAIEFLWNATGQKFGLCPVTIRPCDSGCYKSSTYRGWSGIPRGGWGWGSWEPYIFNGNWYNIACGSCQGQCDSSHMSTVQIPGPVASVSEVVLDGAVFTDWTFDNLGLHRTDGDKWPFSQKQALPLTEPDTWGVTYMQGIAVPDGGQMAAGTLACEFAKAACGSGECALPRRVQTIVRQGVTVAFQDNFSMLFGKLGPMTGIWLVDQWIASVNYAARRRSRVLTPDAKITRVV